MVTESERQDTIKGCEEIFKVPELTDDINKFSAAVESVSINMYVWVIAKRLVPQILHR